MTGISIIGLAVAVHHLNRGVGSVVIVAGILVATR